MWSEDHGFYFDLSVGGKQIPIKTVAAYWTLLSGVATGRQAKALIDHLRNPSDLWPQARVPSCAADAPGYDPTGGYWRGAIWAPIVTMVIRGLERRGEHDLAREIALKHVALVADVLEQTGTIWENYAPDAPRPGSLPMGRSVRKDFVGWSGIGPILYLLEYGVGLRPDAPARRLEWALRSYGRSGCERFRFRGRVVSLVAEPRGQPGGRTVRVTSDGPFTLVAREDGRERTFDITPGSQTLLL